MTSQGPPGLLLTRRWCLHAWRGSQLPRTPPLPPLRAWGTPAPHQERWTWSPGPISCRGQLGHGLVTSQDSCVSGEWAFERPDLVPGSGVSPETSCALLESPRGTAQGSGESRPEQVGRRVARGSLCVRAVAYVQPAPSLWSSRRAQTDCPEAGGAGVGKGIMKVARVFLEFRARF